MRTIDVTTPIEQFKVRIAKDPFTLLNKLYNELWETEKTRTQLTLPLFSYKDHKPIVFPKSGLNQWNAKVGLVFTKRYIYHIIHVKEKQSLGSFQNMFQKAKGKNISPYIFRMENHSMPAMSI